MRKLELIRDIYPSFSSIRDARTAAERYAGHLLEMALHIGSEAEHVGHLAEFNDLMDKFTEAMVDYQCLEFRLKDIVGRNGREHYENAMRYQGMLSTSMKSD